MSVGLWEIWRVVVPSFVSVTRPHGPAGLATGHEGVGMIDTDELTGLAADASYLRPRMFAIYGFHRSAKGDPLPEQPFLGWGLDFGPELGAGFWQTSGSLHQSESVEKLLAYYQRLGDAHLKWLD